VYSGFVHGASVHILDLYDWDRQRFALAGLENTPVRQSYIADAANYPFRVLACAVAVARRLGLQEIAEEFDCKRKEAEQFIGVISDSAAASLMAAMRSRRGN
jgi:hypothetical protein